MIRIRVSQEGGLDWPILKRWEVPWQWQTASLTSLACGLRFPFAVIEYLIPNLRMAFIWVSCFC